MKKNFAAFLIGITIPLWCFSQQGPKIKITGNDTCYCLTAKELKQDIIPDLITGDQAKKELSYCEEQKNLQQQSLESKDAQIRILEKEKAEHKKETDYCVKQRDQQEKKIKRMKIFNKVQNTAIAVLLITAMFFYFV